METMPRFVRRVVIVLVDNSGESTIAALRRGMSLRPTTVRAVHFVLDSQRAEGFGPTGRHSLPCRWS
jgi:hypothetical protein